MRKMNKMDIDSILQEDIFRTIEPERIDALKELLKESKGKNMQETMMLMMKYNKALNSGRKISRAERDAMLEVLLQNVDEDERNQFRGIMKMVEMMNNN